MAAHGHPEFHLFESEAGHFLFLTNGSRLFRVSRPAYERLYTSAMGDSAAVDTELTHLGLQLDERIDDTPLQRPKLYALSLSVAQKCNLGCTYCYAREGDFGAPARSMSLEVALGAVELLFRDVEAGERVSIAFLGGEPLFNRLVIQAATRRAAALAAERGVQARFSITTNGTLLEPGDGEFFEEHGFSVTVSLDGIGRSHDQQRAYKGGGGTFSRIVERLKPLLAIQRRMQISARVTVSSQNLNIVETLDAFIAMGFHGAGFSPLLYAPSGRGELSAGDLEKLLEQMQLCGHNFERAVISGQRYPFSNMVNAMRELHRGTHRPYPCGAGAGYMAMSADGNLYSCHRFVNEPEGAMGSLEQGIDRGRQEAWLTTRHVHRQTPCKECWARYLCGGGCHHEVLHRGRVACDYVRGWLNYCLQAYTRLVTLCPDEFGRICGESAENI